MRGKARIDLDRLFEDFNRLIGFACKRQGPSRIAADDQRKRIVLQGALRLRNRFRIPAHSREALAVPGVCHGVIGIVGQGAAEFVGGVDSVPVVVKIDETQRGMGFGESVVHFQGSLRGFLGGRESLFRREHSVKTKCGIGIRNADVGFRKRWVESNCLAEVFQALLHPLVGSLVPEIAALDVSLIGVWSLRGALGEPASLFPGQFQADGLGNALRERVLQGKDVGEFLVEGFTPELHAVAHADELYGQTNAIGLSLNASVENGIDALLLTSCLWAQIRCQRISEWRWSVVR